MRIDELQAFLKGVELRSKMTPEEWSQIEISVNIPSNVSPERIRFNLNISDSCVDRLHVWSD